MDNIKNREFNEELKDKLSRYSSYEVRRGLTLVQELQPNFISRNQSNEDIDSPEFQAWFDQGINNFNLGNNQAAINCLSQALQIAPNHIESLCLRSLSYVGVEDYEKANKDLEIALEIDQNQTKSIRFLYLQALKYSLLENQVQARQKFLEILYVLPESQSRYASIDWYIRASTYFLCGNKKEALENINQSLHLDPHSVISLILRSSIHVQLGKLESGVEDLNKALVINACGENSALILYMRGLTYFDLGNYYSTIEDLTKALELNPQHEQSCLSLHFRGLAHFQIGNFQKCFEDLTQALAINRNHKNATLTFYCRGIVHFLSEEFQGTIEDLTEALKIDPEHEQVAFNFYYRGLAYFQLGEFSESIKDLTQALEINPSHEQVALNFYYRGLAYQQIGVNTRASQDLKVAFELNPSLKE